MLSIHSMGNEEYKVGLVILHLYNLPNHLLDRSNFFELRINEVNSESISNTPVTNKRVNQTSSSSKSGLETIYKYPLHNNYTNIQTSSCL